MSQHGAGSMYSLSNGAAQDIEDILPEYRRFPHKSHLIFYKPTGKNNILVIRILHHHMDAIRHIQD